MSWSRSVFIARFSGRSAVSRVLRAGGSDVLLEAVTDGQQLALGHHVLAAMFEVVLVHVRLDDGIDRAALFAEAAEDALEQVDVVTRGAALAVFRARGRVDGDRQGRAHRLAQLARDAAFFTVGVPAQRVQAAEA